MLPEAWLNDMFPDGMAVALVLPPVKEIVLLIVTKEVSLVREIEPGVVKIVLDGDIVRVPLPAVPGSIVELLGVWTMTESLVENMPPEPMVV